MFGRGFHTADQSFSLTLAIEAYKGIAATFHILKQLSGGDMKTMTGYFRQWATTCLANSLALANSDVTAKDGETFMKIGVAIGSEGFLVER